MTLLMLLTTVSAWADLSGKCGTNTWYHYYSADQKLRIYIDGGSTGYMTNYDPDHNYPTPWSSVRADITKVIIDEGVTSIGNYAFYGCTALTDVTIPNTVTDIGNGAFNGCSSLTSLDFPDNLSRIGNAAFSGCEHLSSVELPNTVVTIEDFAFERCKALSSLDFPSGVTNISRGVFMDCTSLTSFTIPDGVTSIGESAFMGCSALIDVSIPNSVTSIGNQAFYHCTALVSITLTSNLEEIGFLAFDGCSALSTVYCYATEPPSLVLFRDEPPFSGNASGRKFYVPEESLAAYQESWSKYRNDIVGIPVYTITLAVSPDNSFGTATVSSTVAAQGDKVTLTATPNEGYMFVWWDVTGGAVITKPSAMQTTLTMPKKNVTLTALFRGTDDNPNTYTLTLDDNDGNPYGMAEIHQGIKSYTLPTRTRTGYVFLGWATSATGTPAYQVGETVVLEHNLTLYAIWLQTPVELVNDAPNAATINKLKDLGAIDVKLSGRSLYKDGYWNTLCLPFDVTAEQIVRKDHPLYGADIMELDVDRTYDTDRQTGFDAMTGTLYLYFTTATAIEAGKPYIIKWGTPSSNPDAPIDVIYNPTFASVTINATGSLSVTSSDNAVSFLGNYNPVSIGNKGDNTILFMGEENTLYYPNAAMQIGSFRAYFQLNNGLTCGNPSQGGSGINSFVLNFGEETNSIEEIPNIKSQTSNSIGWFTLDGRKLSCKPTVKGIYINNGKKVVIK